MSTLLRTSERRRRVAISAAVLAVAGWIAVPAWAQKAPAGAPAPGGAAGTLQLGKTTVTLKHAYALGPMEMGGKLYQVVLTDGPVPPDALAKELARGGQPLLKSGKLSGITLLVGETGFVRTMVPFVGDLRGSNMLASVGRLESFAITPTGLTGQGRQDIGQTMGQGWSYSASWNAPVSKP